MDSSTLLSNVTTNTTDTNNLAENQSNFSEEWSPEKQSYAESLVSKAPAPWSAYCYLVFIYAIGLALLTVAVNCKAKHRAAFVFGFCAIGIEILRCASGMHISYAVQDTIVKAIIIQCMGSVVMILREKFVLTEEQKKLPWGPRAIATYKILWNGRFVGTSRPAPVYHLLKETTSANPPSAVSEKTKLKEKSEAEKRRADQTLTNNQNNKLREIDSAPVETPLQEQDSKGLNQGVMPHSWYLACKYVVKLWYSPRLRWMMKALAQTYLIIHADNVKNILVQRYLHFTWEDIVDHKRGIVRRYFRGEDVTAREAVIRAYFAFEGVWGAYSWYTRVHLLCALFFVGIGVDEPEEWPPVFGDIRQAWNMRRYWSKYFDRIIYRSINGWGEMLMEFTGFGLRPFRGSKRWVLNGLVFAISGLFHAYTDRLSGIECGFWAEAGWWMGNYGVIVIETAFLWLLRTYFPRFYDAMSGRIGKTIGFFWVFSWLWWSSPKNQFSAILCMTNTY